MPLSRSLLAGSAVFLGVTRVTYADPGIGSLEGLALLLTVFYVLIGLLIAMVAAWLWLSVGYWTGRSEFGYRVRTYLALSIVITLSSGIGAFIFHQDAPYSQNPILLAVAVTVGVMSALSLRAHYKNTA